MSRIYINSYSFSIFLCSLSLIPSFAFFPFHLFLFPPLFFLFSLFPLFLPRTTPHYTRTITYSLTTYTHITHRTQTTHKGTPFSLSLSLFPFVCGVGVVRGMSMGCEWICCGAGCGVVRVPFSLSLFLFLDFLFSSFPWWVCMWACTWGVLGGLGVCVCVFVGLGVLIDVAAPQRGDQV